MTAKVSSIHVNGWFGDYDKLGMTRTADARALRRRSRRRARAAMLFVGDSPNDAPMFGYLPELRSAWPTCATSPRGIATHRPT